MNIRPFRDSDLPEIIDLAVETFRPFYEGYVRALLGDELFLHQHGQWEKDYHDDVPALHNPEVGSFVAIGEMGGTIAGFVS